MLYRLPSGQGDENLWLMVAAGVVGNVIGSWIAYGVGRYKGREWALRWHWLYITPKRLDSADRWFARYGDWAVLLSRCLPIIRTFISLPAGIARMPFWRFTILTLVGCIPWVLMLTLAGRAVGDNWEDLQKQLHYLDYALILISSARSSAGGAPPAPPAPWQRGPAVDADAMRPARRRERVEALFNRGEIDRIEEFVTPDFVNHEAWPGEDPGYEGFRLRMRRLHEAISDLRHGGPRGRRRRATWSPTGRRCPARTPARCSGSRRPAAASASSTCTCCACATGGRRALGEPDDLGMLQQLGDHPRPPAPGRGLRRPDQGVEAAGSSRALRSS